MFVSDAGEDKRSRTYIVNSGGVQRNVFQQLQNGVFGRQLKQSNNCQGAEYCIDGCPYDFVDQECQDSSSSSLSGDKYPFVLSLQEQRTSKDGDGESIVGCYSRFCSAALIYSDVAVTTADCLQPLLLSPSSQTPSQFKDVIQVARDQKCLHLNGSEMGFVDIGIIHPDYDNNTEDNNLGVIVLKKGMSEEFGLAVLPTSNEFQGAAKVFSYNQNLSLRNYTSVSILARTQQAVVISDTLCIPLLESQDSRTVEFFNKSTEICAIVDEDDNCAQGGGGSPLFLEDVSNVTLLGLGSWRPAGRCKQPHVFTQVASYTEWIQQQIQKYSNVYRAVPSPSPSPTSIPTTSPAVQDGCAAPCHDIPPDRQFPCAYYTYLDLCDDDILRNENGQFAYCFCSCGRCVPGADVPAEPTSVDLIEHIDATGSNSAIAVVSAISTYGIPNVVSNAVASAMANISAQLQADGGADPQTKAIDAARGTAEVVATAIATDFAATEISAVTRGDSSRASRIAGARAETIAIATASVFVTAFASTRDLVEEFSASTFENDVRTTLVNSYSELQISGNSQARVVNEVIGTALARVVANATAEAFSSYANSQAQAINPAIAEAEASACPAACNNNPPNNSFTCEQQQEWGKCGESYMKGFCECVCHTCALGYDVILTTSLINGQVVDATNAILAAVILRQSDEVAQAVAEAIGRGAETFSVAYAMVEAINIGGEGVISALADCFLFLKNSNGSALSNFISESVGSNKTTSDAIGTIISFIIDEDGCSTIYSSLDDAEKIVNSTGEQMNFRAALPEQVQYCIAFPEQDCKDVYLQETTDCNIVVINDLCDIFRGVYCSKTCGHCDYKIEDDEEEEKADNYSLGKKSDTCSWKAYDFSDSICRGINKQIFFGESGSPPTYMISLQVPKDRKQRYGKCFEHFCGGALIAPNIVITAAHCIDERYFGQINKQGRSEKEVYAARAPDCRHDQGFDRLLVHKSFIYKEYEANHIQGDVAILELSGSWEGPYLQYQPAWNQKTLPDQLDLTIMGYGKQSEDDSGYKNYPFMYLQMYYLPDYLCTFTMIQNGYTQSMQDIFSQQLMLCAQADKGATCEGDSGGPLVIKDQTDEANDILVGINSFGRNVACGQDQLTFFAEVGRNNITLWIHGMVRKYGSGYGDLYWQTPPPLKG